MLCSFIVTQWSWVLLTLCISRQIWYYKISIVNLESNCSHSRTTSSLLEFFLLRKLWFVIDGEPMFELPEVLRILHAFWTVFFYHLDLRWSFKKCTKLLQVKCIYQTDIILYNLFFVFLFFVIRLVLFILVFENFATEIKQLL